MEIHFACFIMYNDPLIFRITTTSVCQDGELVTKNKEGSEGGESNRYVNILLVFFLQCMHILLELSGTNG